MATEPRLFVYSAVNTVGTVAVAVAPEDADPVNELLYWAALDEGQTVNDYLASIGYEDTRLRAHPTITNVTSAGKQQRLRFGKTRLRPGIPLIAAKDAAANAGCDTNTFRLYARRGYAPKPYENGKKVKWVEPEVVWWATHRRGQGNRTKVVLTASDE